MAWVSYRPTPGKNTTRYRNTETGETRSRRQPEKATLNPTKYNQYYRRGVTKRDTKKYTKAETKHKIVSVTRWQDLQNLINGQKPPKGKDLTAFVRVTNHATGEQKQTNSVAVSGDWRYLLNEYAVALFRKYFSPPGEDDEGDPDELSDEEQDAAAELELEYELVFVSDL